MRIAATSISTAIRASPEGWLDPESDFWKAGIFSVRSIQTTNGPIHVLPFISTKLWAMCDLSILFLRKEEHGRLI
ncbi:MAG: hypothetical protein WA446_17950, partial [Steroidobacteraceae bacterium]